MATEVTCIVDTDATQSPDYTSLSAAIVGEAGATPKCVTGADLVANDEQLTILCRATTGVADTTDVTISGFTVDETRCVKILADTGHRHEGVWDDSKYRIVGSVGNMIILAIDWVTIGYLQLYQNADANASCITTYDAYPEYFTIYGCIFKGNMAHTRGKCGIYGYTAKAWIYNNIFYDMATLYGKGIEIRGPGGGFTSIYNNTFVDLSLTGVVANNDSVDRVRLSNNLAIECTLDYTDPGAGAYEASSTHNGYNIADPAANGIDLSLANATDLFVDYAGKDFRLKAGSPCLNVGADLSADGDLPFNYDIKDVSRPQGAAWDIGADELEAAASDFTRRTGVRIQC